MCRRRKLPVDGRLLSDVHRRCVWSSLCLQKKEILPVKPIPGLTQRARSDPGQRVLDALVALGASCHRRPPERADLPGEAYHFPISSEPYTLKCPSEHVGVLARERPKFFFANLPHSCFRDRRAIGQHPDRTLGGGTPERRPYGGLVRFQLFSFLQWQCRHVYESPRTYAIALLLSVDHLLGAWRYSWVGHSGKGLPRRISRMASCQTSVR